MNPSERYIDRDLSALKFNERVTDEADNPSLPLFERLRFLSIAADNLDEFVSVRVASLVDELESPQGDPQRMARLEAILAQVMIGISEQTQRQQSIWRALREELRAKTNIHVLKTEETSTLSQDDRLALRTIFTDTIFPLLTPMAIDPTHNFPFLANKSLATLYTVKKGGKLSTRVVPLPPHLPRLIELPKSGEKRRYILLEHAIRLNLDILLPNMEIEDYTTFRLLRNAELDLDSNAATLAQSMEKALQGRKRGEVTLMTLNARASDDTSAFLQKHLGVDDTGIVRIDGIMGLGDLSILISFAPPEMLFAPYITRYPERVIEHGGDIFSAIAQKDFIVHHPYERFDVVVDLLQQAARDPHVRTIKQTLYRTSSDSPIVRALIDAARNGKSVAAVVEIRARFDEEANMQWARDMEREGVHVTFGSMDLKTHAKMTLVVRQEDGVLKRYCHLGTGNYHPQKAKIYTDLSFFTCNDSIGNDVGRIFNYITGSAEPDELEKLDIAPLTLRKKLEALIDGEIARAQAGEPASIWIKANALEDEKIVDKLYKASQAGVKIDCVIRGICRLRPGVPGLSENITVKSIVGRFLEHSRVYVFGNGHALPSKNALVYIASADMMHRNLNRRIETLVPIENPTVHSQVLDQIMVANFKDNTQSWTLDANGVYTRSQPNGQEPFSAHQYFISNPSLSGRGKAKALTKTGPAVTSER